jgi:hypothetical protein
MLKENFDKIAEEIHEFKELDYDEFARIMTVVYSRVLTIQVNSVNDQPCILPYVDFMNHSNRQ